jgi:hypothetical protein
MPPHFQATRKPFFWCGRDGTTGRVHTPIFAAVFRVQRVAQTGGESSKALGAEPDASRNCACQSLVDVGGFNTDQQAS